MLARHRTRKCIVRRIERAESIGSAFGPVSEQLVWRGPAGRAVTSPYIAWALVHAVFATYNSMELDAQAYHPEARPPLVPVPLFLLYDHTGLCPVAPS